MCLEKGVAVLGGGQWGCTAARRTWVLETNGTGNASPRPHPVALGLRWQNLHGFFAYRGNADQRHVSFSLLVSREFGHGCFLGDAWASFTTLGGPGEKSRQMLRLIPATFGHLLWLCFLLWLCRAGAGRFPLRHGAHAHPVPPLPGKVYLIGCITPKSPVFSAFYPA